MHDLVARTALWAMHPDMMDAVLTRGTVAALVPDGLQALLGMAKHEARAQADPVRDGATVIYPITGVLSPRGNYAGGGTATEILADRMREFAADPKIGTIVLKVGSPGGMVYGTPEAADAIYEARQSKPVIAVATPYAFSAAYWLATQCSAFYASPSADVGNVGVRGGHVDRSGLEDKIGLKTTLIASSPEKIMAHPYGPLSDEDRAELQAQVDESNRTFAAAIARGRGIPIGDVERIHGSGRTFSAQQATASGAIDGVMTLRDVVAKYASSRSRLALMRRRAASNEVAAAI